MNLNEVKFPALRICDRGIIKLQSRRQLNVVPHRTLLAAQNGDSGEILDSKCAVFTIRRVVGIRRSFNPVLLLDRYPSFVVNYEFARVSRIPFDKAKEHVARLIVDKGWYRQGGETVNQFERWIDQIQTIDELLDGISGYGECWY